MVPIFPKQSEYAGNRPGAIKSGKLISPLEERAREFNNKSLKLGTEENPIFLNLKKNMNIPYVYWPMGCNEKRLLLMIDSGADISIIKKGCVPPEAEIYGERLHIKGIGGGSLVTSEKAIMQYKHGVIAMHIVQNDIGFIGDGILGADFFTDSGAEICFRGNVLKIRELRLPLLSIRDRVVEFDKRSKKGKVVGKGEREEEIEFLGYLELTNIVGWDWENKFDFLNTFNITCQGDKEEEPLGLNESKAAGKIDKILELINVREIDEFRRNHMIELIKQSNDCIYLQGNPGRVPA